MRGKTLSLVAVVGVVAIVLSATLVFENPYEELMKWQTLIAGVVGFGGLAWATYRGALNATQRDEYLRNQEAAAFSIALAWELSYQRIELITIRQLCKQLEEAELEGPGERLKQSELLRDRVSTFGNLSIFHNQSDKVCLLPSPVIGAIGEYHADLEDAKRADWGDYSRASLQKIEDRLRLTCEFAEQAIEAIREFLASDEGLPEISDGD